MYLHVNTPAILSNNLTDKTGKNIFLKLENTQPAGSFKIRGIGHIVQHALAQGYQNIVSSSGGNAGYATAYAGKMLGIQTTVFVPTTTSPKTVRKLQELNATVFVKGEVWDETNRHAHQFAHHQKAFFVPPFNHPLLWKGHATLIDELVIQTSKPEAIILAVGGGGLLCGVLEGLHKNGWQDVPVIAVETEGTASFALSQQKGQLATLDRVTGIATSLGAKTVAEACLQWNKQHKIISQVVTDQQALNACIAFANEQRFLVEPACGATLSVVYENMEVIKNMKDIVLIVCGGINVDLDYLQHAKAPDYI